MEIQIIISIFFTILVFFKFRTKLKTTKNLPPGPWKLPVIGNLHNLAGALPHRELHSLSLKFGPVMALQLGELSAVVISSPDAAKQVMKTHDINFASRPRIIAAEIINYGCTSITFSPYGDYWRRLRKICTLELLSAKRVQSFRSLRERVFGDLTRWIASKEGSPINLTEELYSSTYALISEAAVGGTEQREELLPVFKEGLELAAGFDIADLFPSVKLVQMMSGLRRKMTALHRKIDRILEDVIHEHRVRRWDQRQNHEDLLDVLLKLQGDELELPLTTDNIKSVVLDMLVAGSETSATTLDWAMVEMLRNPNILEKAQDEVRQVFDEKGYVEESLVSELKYLKSVVKETLRLHPPAPLLLPRKCIGSCEINGYEIHAETRIIINAWALNRDPNYWEDAHNFWPERFDDNLVDYKGNNFEYIPFGAGRRICPGISFGMANVEMPLAMFLYHFDWKLADEMQLQKMDMTEGFGVTVRRIKNLLVVPVITRPLPTK